MRQIITWSTALSLFALIAAAGTMLGVSVAQAQTAGTASARLTDASGKLVGTATLTQQADGVRIVAQVQDLPAGQHGIHIHAAGKCEGPDFASAGGHFNPASKQHGLRNPQGAHAGDLPNLTVAANGNGSFNAVDTMVILGAGANSLFGPDGTALVIHVSADDEMTDPTGNSGGRIACGTIVRGAAALPATGFASAAAPTVTPGVLGALLAGVGGVAAGVLRWRRRQ